MTFLKHCKTGLLAFWLAPKNHGKSGLHHEHVAPHEKTERRGMSFPIPRPRGKDMPSATPRGRARSKAPMQGAIPPPTKSMDSTGRFTVSVVSPPHFGIVGALRPAHAPHFNDAEFSAQQALEDSRRIRTKRAGQSVFDKSTGGTK